MATPTVALSPVEAAALADLPEGKVRKEVEYGFFGDQTPPRLGFSALVYLRALRSLDLDLGVADRLKLSNRIRDALKARRTPEVIELGEILSLRLGPLVREIAARVNAFEAWKQRLVTRQDILGGEPVFPNSRLAVRRVGALAERGESVEAILHDYPYLTGADVDFARLYAKAYPRVGRPRENR